MTSILFAAVAATNLQITVTASPIAREELFTVDGAEVCTVGADQTSRLTAQDLPTVLRSVPDPDFIQLFQGITA